MAVAKVRYSEEPVGSKSQIKDLLAHMDPMIYLAGTADNTSEMLAYLADMDPAFHKLELVKGLRKEMRERLGNDIEARALDYLEQHKGKMREDNPVDVLVENIHKVEIFTDFVEDVQESLKGSVQDISDHFDDEIVTGMFSSEDDDLTFSASPNDSNESSLNSSLNQSGLLFLHPAQYSNMARSLLSKKDSHTWNDSLNILISVTPGEPVLQDCWPDLRKGLRDCLFDESLEIFDKALKVHCKLLTSQVQNAVKEGYLNLLDAVAGFYMSKRLISKMPIKGEPVDLNSCEKTIRILKVVTEFQQELPLIWIRYPERFVDDMVEATFHVLSLHLGKRDSKLMNVLDMLSIVDSQTLWFKRWVHGQWGRNKTFSAMKSNSLILLYSVSFCIQYLEKCSGTIEVNSSESDNSAILSSSLILHQRFTQYLNLIMTVISYSDGRKLFPVNIPSKEELVTIQGVIQILVKAYNSRISKAVVLEIGNHLQEFCIRDEVKCWILCDAGVIESLLQEVGCLDRTLERRDKTRKSESDIYFAYIQSAFDIFQCILSTQVGQKYILLGRKRKASSKSGLSTVTSSQAYEVMNLIHLVLKNENADVELRSKAISVCSAMLSSPIGMHMCLEHPLVEGLVEYLQGQEPKSPQRLQRIPSAVATPLYLSDSQTVPLLTALLSSYKGIFLLESEGILPVVLKQVLPKMAESGKLDPRILAYVCASSEGSSIVGDLKIVHPYWDILCHVVSGEEPGQQPPTEEEKEEAQMAAVAPLTAITATYFGTKLLFSEKGLLSNIYEAVFCSDDMLGGLHHLALQLLGSATSVLDSLAFLQASFSYQERLLTQQSQMSLDDGNTVIIDENSVLRNHILVKSYFLGGNGERSLPPLVIESNKSAMPQPFTSYPPPRDYIPEKPIRSMHKKQNDVWRFLSDTRHGLHDIGWLNHCRKSVRSVLIAGEDIKSWLVMDIIERAVRALLTSTEELLPGSPLSNITNNATLSTSSSNSSSPNSLTGPSPLPESSRSSSINENSQSFVESHLVAMELMLRYGSELQLLTGSGSFKENLVDVISYTEASILSSKPERCDWFTMVIFLICGGNAERCRSVLTNISGVLVGGVLWPCFSDALTVTHELLPGEVSLSGIIHNVQLVLSIEIPLLFSSLQANDSCLWNIIGEWVRCLFLGILPWLEVCHYLIIVLLQGPDYAVYFIVAFLRHLQNIIIKYAGSHKCLTILQTSTITGWRAGEHLNFMEVLSRRHRRTILPALISPFYNLRHQYTLRQL